MNVATTRRTDEFSPENYEQAIKELDNYVVDLKIHLKYCAVKMNKDNNKVSAHFCKLDDGSSHWPKVNVSETNNVLVVMVGPPARGKSATFNKLTKVFRDIAMINAGDVRRVYETELKKRYRTATDHAKKDALLNKLMEYCSNKERKQEMMDWLKNDTSTAIPGGAFKDFADLNEKFAVICLDKAMAMLNENKSVFFDATNTTIERRKKIIDTFLNSNSTSKKNRLLFIENICTNQIQLKKNFISKLAESGDYKGEVNKKCKKNNANSNVVTRASAVVKNTSLYEIPNMQKNDDECRMAVINALADILTRDYGYVRKYVPMNSNKGPSGESTLTTIRAANKKTKNKNIAFLQLVLRMCLPESDEFKNIAKNIRGLQNSNIYLPFLKRLLYALVADSNDAASYGQTGRVEFHAEDLRDLLDPHSPK